MVSAMCLNITQTGVVTFTAPELFLPVSVQASTNGFF